MIDLALLSLAYAGAFFIRFDGPPPAEYTETLLVSLPGVVLLRYASLAAFKVTRGSWRYVGLHDMVRAYLACAVPSVVLLGLRRAALTTDGSVLDLVAVPGGVILTDFVLAFFAVAGVRAMRRLLDERRATRLLRPASERVPTMLVGAGQAGYLVAKEIQARPDLGIHAVGFLDDDSRKVGTAIHGVPVLGATKELPRLCAEAGAQQVIITIANAPGHDIRRIADICEGAGIPVKIIPGVYEIVGGQVNLSRIRPVAIEDLLRREPVELDVTSIRRFIDDKVVLVTGAGGSIGSELCRQIAEFSPERLILLDRAENALFEVDRELRERWPSLALDACVADVCDESRTEAVFGAYRPHVVFHAAAHKHVPLMETNPGEAVKNNTFGTCVLARAAHVHQTAAFVFISTDKAVNPSSVMGSSKRAACRYLEGLDRISDTRFIIVRFGNVLDSAGSVVPIFRRQIEAGGPVTVTHPEMVRYFMTIPEAAQLVLQASSMGQGGEIFTLDMGEPVRIADLASDMIRLSGFRPMEDIEIVYTGVRPGEKLFEELTLDEEHAQVTRHPKIFIGRANGVEPLQDLERKFKRLEAVCDRFDGAVIREVLCEIVTEYRPAAGVIGNGSHGNGQRDPAGQSYVSPNGHRRLSVSGNGNGQPANAEKKPSAEGAIRDG
ncbi:MAG: polysaccharide biosynthesis protein [Actinobacteria bacterium]|nr:polysaccharide biosynthesis protein [Actinomycetota bacterium]